MREFAPSVDAWIGRHRVMVHTIAIILAIIFLPLVPFRPQCYEAGRGWVNLGAVVLAPAYRDRVLHYLRAFDVPYLAIGGVVLIRSWIWLSGGPDDELVNASNKPIYMCWN